MAESINLKNAASFINEVQKASDIKLRNCYQCGKCSASCPMVFQMDYPPSTLIRHAQLGLKEEVLTSKTIWSCVSCITCTARCPKEIDIAALMDVFREMSVKEKLATKEQAKIQKFHKSFLEVIRAHGRLYEMSLIIRYKLRTLALMQDVNKTPKMLFAGKLNLFPPKIENIEAIRKIFERCSE
ncbi:MAG: 4Fe-4S dicluster domain-containing protein [Planctomycetes bacterium]|nr:4Fe-4S dicluster domain-containing protein [Planctomycetota bacterium]